MFTHVDLTTNATFTTGEKLTGATSERNWYCYVRYSKEIKRLQVLHPSSPSVATLTSHVCR